MQTYPRPPQRHRPSSTGSIWSYAKGLHISPDENVAFAYLSAGITYGDVVAGAAQVPSDGSLKSPVNGLPNQVVGGESACPLAICQFAAPINSKSQPLTDPESKVSAPSTLKTATWNVDGRNTLIVNTLIIRAFTIFALDIHNTTAWNKAQCTDYWLHVLAKQDLS